MAPRTRLSKSEKETRRTEALDALRKMIKPGDAIYVTCSGTTRSNMGAWYKLFIPVQETIDGENRLRIEDITWRVSDILDWKWRDDGSMYVGGCGLDRAYHTVMRLSSALFPDAPSSSYQLHKHNL